MLRKKEVLTAVCTLGCAMAIGFVMQNTEEAQLRYGTKVLASAPIQPTQFSNAASLGQAVLDVTEITLTSASLRERVDVSSDVETLKTFLTPEDGSGEPHLVFAAACDIEVRTEIVPAAIVHMELSAPCLPNERVTMHHHGMMFTETTSDAGTLSIEIPALAQEAVFVAAFPSGEGVVVTADVAEFAEYDRTVLQWRGNSGFEIHAREFGAKYGTDGHHWIGDPGSVASVIEGKGGLLTSLGNRSVAEPLLAEVYTFPKNDDGHLADVVLTVEAEVTQKNCGLEVEAQSLEMQPDGQVQARNLLLPVPACDSIGSFLVLNNLLQNLKVASK